VANWAGTDCWGFTLNRNFVRMNMTATIAWSLIWSVYDDWPYFGNGLMYAMWPWSNHYEVNGPIWTSAHTCQFVEAGWTYIPHASGNLQYGGSYVSLTDKKDVTIVIEKLAGKCLRCGGESLEEETVSI